MSALQEAAAALEKLITEFGFHSRTTLTAVRVLAELEKGSNAGQAAVKLGVPKSVAIMAAKRHGLQRKVGHPKCLNGSTQG